MDLNTWLDQEKGRTKAVSDHFGVSPSAVSQWRMNGVPATKMKALHLLTRGKVPVEKMLPRTEKA